MCSNSTSKGVTHFLVSLARRLEVYHEITKEAEQNNTDISRPVLLSSSQYITLILLTDFLHMIRILLWYSSSIMANGLNPGV